MTVREMSDVTRIQYLRSDITVSTQVYDSATQIFSALVGSKKVTSENKNEMMELAVNLALELAIVTEKVMAQTGKKSSDI